MKNFMKAIPVIVLSILLFSCDQKETIQNEPMALLEMAPTNAIKAVESSDSFEYGSFSRLQYSDDVDVLYEALLAKNERLRSLESSIEKLNSTVADQKDDWIALYLNSCELMESSTFSFPSGKLKTRGKSMPLSLQHKLVCAVFSRKGTRQ